MDDFSPRACRRLWAEIFLAGMSDAWNDVGDGWCGSRDYFATADLAGLDAGAARDLAVALRTRHARLRAAGADKPRSGRLPVGILRCGAAA